MNDDQCPRPPDTVSIPTQSDPYAKSNAFESRIFFAVVAVAGALAIIAALLISPVPKRQAAQAQNENSARADAETQLEHPRRLANFTLTNSSGQKASRADLAGKFLIVNFVFTSCSLGCPSDRRMTEIQRLVEDMPDVRLLSLAIDPRSDTPEALAKFAGRLKADTNRWLFLTGDKPSLYGLIESSFIKPSPELIGVFPGGFDYADRIILVDRQGNVSDTFNGITRASTTNVISRIEALRSKSPSR